MRCKGIIKTHNSSESCICLWKFNFKDFKGFKGFKDLKEQGAGGGGKRVVGSREQGARGELRGAEGLRRRHSISCE